MIDKNTTHLAGEFLVAGELSRRGYPVAITFGNAKSVDIYATTQQGEIKIDAKAWEAVLPAGAASSSHSPHPRKGYSWWNRGLMNQHIVLRLVRCICLKTYMDALGKLTFDIKVPNQDYALNRLRAWLKR